MRYRERKIRADMESEVSPEVLKRAEKKNYLFSKYIQTRGKATW